MTTHFVFTTVGNFMKVPLVSCEQCGVTSSVEHGIYYRLQSTIRVDESITTNRKQIQIFNAS